MTPADRVFGLDEEAAREDVLSYARRYGITSVAIKRAGSDADWYGYLRVVDAAVIQRPLHTLIQPMPRLDPTTRKLEALLVLRDSGAAHAVVCEEDRVLGIVSERGLVEQLMRPPQTLGTRLLPSEL
jgi:CBS domain-containing protein